MELLRDGIKQLPEYRQLLAALDGGRSPVALSGLSAIHRVHFAAAASGEQGVVLLCADEGEGQRLARDAAALTGEEVPVLTARSFHLQPGTVASHQWEQRRLALLDGLRRDRYPLIVATVEGLMQRTLPPQTLEGACVTLEVGGRYDLNDLAAALTRAGYTRCQQVEGPGQFALRGGT